MAGQTITATVTLGSSSYTSPLTIASNSTIAPSAGAIAIYGPASLTGFTLINQGTIAGGTGGQAHYSAGGGAGGAGAVLTVAAFYNDAGISGGNGGISAAANQSGAGGAAGDGVDLTTGTIFNNQGHISGGSGGASHNGYQGGSGAGGTGGIGASLANVAVITNSGTIAGGLGGTPGAAVAGGGAGGAGGNGFDDTSTSTTSLANTGIISGGAGGTGGADDGTGGTGGHGGTGIALTGAVTLSNSATISGGAGGTGATDLGQNYSGANGGAGGAGATLSGTTSLTNAPAGTIAGGAGGGATSSKFQAGAGGAGADGLDSSSTGSIINHGTITAGAGAKGGSSILGQQVFAGGAGGAGGAGIAATQKLSINNTGLIQGGAGGASGVGANATAGAAGGAGVVLAQGDTLTNSGRITAGAGGTGGTAPSPGAGGAGGAGIYLNDATLINSGTITGGTGGAGGMSDSGTGTANGTSGAAGDAVKFGGTAASTLIVEAGAVFIGNVVANTTTDILDLSGTSTTELTGIGTQFQNFNQISFAPNAAWTIAGNTTGLANGETINGFDYGDTIDLTGFATTSDSFHTNVLTLTNATSTAKLDIKSDYATPIFHVQSDGTGGTLIEVTCFCSGTRILGLHGEILAEDIAVGDELITMRENGPATQKVIWTGRRAIDISRHPQPELVRPIRITAGAIASGVPERDLRLSPEHAIYLGGNLFTAMSLINGTTIFQEQNTSHVTYHHIELETHDILMANGLPCESYLDTGSKKMFENVSGVLVLHPDFRPGADSKFCAPLIRDGEALEELREQLTARIRKLA
jgi:hypothetical protein